ncbi:MAG TPA: hypothetical protein VGS62_10565 [Streptosporangiaceae bacterium]|nr:hypothetical protein [Streptosporangiaceae bacterium]
MRHDADELADVVDVPGEWPQAASTAARATTAVAVMSFMVSCSPFAWSPQIEARPGSPRSQLAQGVVHGACEPD